MCEEHIHDNSVRFPNKDSVKNVELRLVKQINISYNCNIIKRKYKSGYQRLKSNFEILFFSVNSNRNSN